MFVALLASWKLTVEPALPPRLFHGEGDRGEPRWIEPIGTFLTHGDVDAAEVLFLGDSRMSDGIVLDVLDAESFPAYGMLWGASARLTDLVPAAERFDARRLVVGVSMLSLERPRRTAAAVARRGSAPPTAGPRLAEQLDRWATEQTEVLVEQGFDRARAELVLAGLADLQLEASLRTGMSPRAIDARLNDWLDGERRELLKVIEPERWGDGWVYEIDEARSDAVYTARLAAESPDVLRATALYVGGLLKGLVERGYDVVCVRLPMAEGLRAIEEQGLTREEFASIAETAGVPYLDYSRDVFATRDGSHLVVPAARAFTQRLVEDLREVKGW